MPAAIVQYLLYDVSMLRPIPMYFIAAWLVIWLIGVPLRNHTNLQALFGTIPTLLIVILALVTAVILVVKFLQCERAYFDLVLGIISMQLGFLLTRYLWLVVIDHEPIDYHLQYLLTLGLNLFYMVYLMLPSTQRRIAQVHAAPLAEQQNK